MYVQKYLGNVNDEATHRRRPVRPAPRRGGARANTQQWEVNMQEKQEKRPIFLLTFINISGTLTRTNMYNLH